MIYKRKSKSLEILQNPKEIVRLFHGDSLELIKSIPDNSIDLVVTSPPYCMGKEYEGTHNIQTFIKAHELILPEIARITKPGGSICWQVGFHVNKGVLTPLDFLVHDIARNIPGLYLRNRMIWAFNHGLHCSTRFSGRHETILWYTKGEEYHFDLDAVRVPQQYPGKRYSKGPRKGELSGNPKGKNPGDIWDIPNVKSKHVEKTKHPCQFPVALVQRLVRAMCPVNGVVFDPFAGSSSTGVAAIIENRRFLGAELEDKYVQISKKRLESALEGTHQIRPLEKEIYKPGPNEKVAMKPEHFWQKLQADFEKEDLTAEMA